LEHPHVATKIKLMRLGKMREPHYRIVVADSRTKRDGRSIEAIGEYHPKSDPSVIRVDSERAQYWLGVGAQPTEAVAAIFRVTGDWQQFKGLPAPEPMKIAAPKADKKAVFEAAAKDGLGGEAKGEATTPRKRAAKAAPAAAAQPAPPAAPAAQPAAPAAAAPPADAPAAAAPPATPPAAQSAAPPADAPAAAAPPAAPPAAQSAAPPADAPAAGGETAES
jgi:small subunit ribosomal protein S16